MRSNHDLRTDAADAASGAPIDVLDEILAIIELRDDDCARLAQLGERLGPELPAIATRFYDKLIAHPGAAPILGTTQRLHATLVEWMATGLVGPYDAAFAAKRARIGRRHVEIGLPQHYMFTAMSVIRGEYCDRVWALYPPAEARLVCRSVDKLLDMELALMLRSYQLDSEQQVLDRERKSQSDRVTALQTLTAGLAHEVRNPLNAAKLQLELLERRLRRDAPAVDLAPMGLAKTEIERLTRMLGDFLAFARPPELALGDHDVAALARAVVEGERSFAAARGAALALESSEPLIARIDPPKVHQVIQNLVRNSIEAVSAGGHVTVALRGDAAHVYVHVQDDGPGIPDGIRGRIYEPFFTTKDSGTGLGMAIVHSMVALHGGTIDIATGPTGTRFAVALPRRA